MSIDIFERDIITRLKDAHERWEGVRNSAYICPAGFLSIGIGHNCIASPVPGVTKVGDRISDDMIKLLYEQDCDKTFDALDSKLPWWRSLSPARAAVLFDMAFNMGVGSSTRGLMSFRNTLQLIKAGKYTEAAEALKSSKWATQVHVRARAMIKQLSTGEWQV